MLPRFSFFSQDYKLGFLGYLSTLRFCFIWLAIITMGLRNEIMKLSILENCHILLIKAHVSIVVLWIYIILCTSVLDYLNYLQFWTPHKIMGSYFVRPAETFMIVIEKSKRGIFLNCLKMTVLDNTVT